MKRILLLFLFSIALITGALFWWNWAIKPASNSETTEDFLITKGASASQVGNKLKDEGLVQNALSFKLYTQFTGKASKIQAGEYSLSPNLSLVQIVDELLRGPKEIWVTVPEGLRREEVAERFATELLKEDKETFKEEFLQSSAGKEGFLFPDTYIFPKTASASVIVAKLLSTFDSRVDSQMDRDIEASNYSLNQILTMASIVERETITDKERPVVAGILFKRLKAGWPLQADATLQYAIANSKFEKSNPLRGRNSKLDKWWEIPEVKDRGLNSPYNTYKNTGLPPGPIANPGLTSISAAIYPEESEYWFYLHDSKGQIHYAITVDEHNENVREFL